MTSAQWKTVFESEDFARQNGYQGPLGAQYAPAGTHLRLWAPTAQSVSVNLYRKGGGGVCIGTLPLSPWGQGVWGVYLPGEHCLLHGVECKFAKPIFIGDTLTVKGTVVGVSEIGSEAEIKAVITNQDGKRVTRGIIKAGLAK